jgi:hypothetical protein
VPESDAERRWMVGAPELAAAQTLAASPKLARAFAHTARWSPQGDPSTALATFLHVVYRDLREFQSHGERRVVDIAVPAIERSRYTDTPRTHVTDILSRLSAHEGFETVAVHGSFATLDECAGVSDLDLALILKPATLDSVESLLEARQAALETWPALQSIDPLQHHGAFVFTDVDSSRYPQTFLPMVVWREARVAGGRGKSLRFACRPTALLRRRLLRRAASFIRGPVPANLFDLKLDLQVVLLAPVFAMQRHGCFLYKRDAFAPFEQSAPADAVEAVAIASRARFENWYGDDVEALAHGIAFDRDEAAPHVLSAAIRQRAARISVRGRLLQVLTPEMRRQLDALADHLDSLVTPLADDVDEEWLALTRLEGATHV